MLHPSARHETAHHLVRGPYLMDHFLNIMLRKQTNTRMANTLGINRWILKIYKVHRKQNLNTAHPRTRGSAALIKEAERLIKINWTNCAWRTLKAGKHTKILVKRGFWVSTKTNLYKTAALSSSCCCQSAKCGSPTEFSDPGKYLPCSFWFSFSILSSNICWRMAFCHSSRSSLEVLLRSSFMVLKEPSSQTGCRGDLGGSSPSSE